MTKRRNTTSGSSSGRIKWSHKKMRGCMAVGIFLLIVMISIEILWPERTPETAMAAMPTADREGQSPLNESDRIKKWLAIIEKRRLFKPALPLPSRKVAQQSVDKIKSLLTLHGVVELNDNKTAYIKIKGEGMKSFRVGDRVEDLFTVTHIDNSSVELEIVGERVRLEM